MFTKKKILLLDKRNIFPEIFLNQIRQNLNLEPLVAKDYQEMQELVYMHHSHLFLALIDFDPSWEGEFQNIDSILENGIPCIVITPVFGEDIRQEILSRNIIDYIYKEKIFDIEYAISLLSRLQKNTSRQILVVEDSITYRKYITGLLKSQMLKVMEANHGNEALLLLENNPGIQLVLTDYNMPYMDGFQLTKIIRQKYQKDSMAILAISDNESKRISSNFLKFGANDYIQKPFSKEEFFCRINLNFDILESFQKLKDAAYKDYLTKLYNRRYFFEKSQEILKEATFENRYLSLGMIDIDFFKKINDNYGHDVGDMVLQVIADILQAYLPDEGIVGRMGGEEFCILLIDYDTETSMEYFESIRRRTERIPISIEDGKTIQCTISIGFTSNKCDNLDKMIKEADEMLYKAKNSGRNQVCCIR